MLLAVAPLSQAARDALSVASAVVPVAVKSSWAPVAVRRLRAVRAEKSDRVSSSCPFLLVQKPIDSPPVGLATVVVSSSRLMPGSLAGLLWPSPLYTAVHQ